MVKPTLGSAGCLLTFRHGGIVQADGCEDMGDALAYLRFGGWVVVLKSSLVSVHDETGVTQFFPRWTSEEMRAQIRAVPKEGGVPIGPTVSQPPAAAPPPEAAQPPPLPQPTVVYYPVPVPVPSQPVYQLPPPPIYRAAVVFCTHCFPRHAVHPKPIPVRVVPTSPSDIGPMAIQKTFPPISPNRSR